MSAVANTSETPTHVSPFAKDGGVSLPRVAQGEWVKLRSLRSTWFSIAATLIIAIGLGALFSYLRATHVDGGGHGPIGIDDPIRVSLRGLMLAQLPIGVLGVLFVTGEYATGMIRSSLAAVPRRWPVLLAKCVVVGVTCLVVCTVGCFFAFLAGQAGLNSHGYGVGLGATGALEAIIGGGIYLTLVALLGIGCGFAIRSTGGAIATLFGLLLVLPLLGEALPTSWANHVNQYLPMNAGTQILGTQHDPHTLSSWTGLGVFALWALAAVVAGLLVLRKRDA